MLNIKTLSAKIDKCPACGKIKLLYNKCEQCHRLFCKNCGYYTLIRAEDVGYYAPEVARCLCAKCKKRHRVINTRPRNRSGVYRYK